MRAWEIQGSFGLENLKLVEMDEPTPGYGQVKLRMKATSLNYRDYLVNQGAYNPRQPLPLIPFSDGVGEVVEVGEGVSRVKVGDRVCPIFAQGWQAGEPSKPKLKTTMGSPVSGTLAEYVVLAEDGVVHAPSNLSDEEAGTLTCAAVTAWSALFEQYHFRPGDVVVVQGTGGVSMFGLLFGLMAGARVIVTSSSDEKLEKVREMGAWGTINYKTTPEWSREVKKLTGGVGADHIIEVGGAGTLNQSLRAVRPGGHISMIGVLDGAAEKLSVIPILMQNICVQGVIVGHREGFEAMNRAIEAHDLKPLISHTFDFDDVHDALELMGRGGHFGKIVITV